jgi:hypothetical protein
MATHTATRTLAGVEGYRRLARLLVRAFYAGEAPPPDAEAANDGEPSAAPAKPSKLPKVGFMDTHYLLEPNHTCKPPPNPPFSSFPPLTVPRPRPRCSTP